MMKFFPAVSAAALLALNAAMVGCNSKPNEQTTDSNIKDSEVAEHSHGESGPHGGDLIELGSGQFHAEILHDANVVVYILDATAQSTAPIDAAELVLNVTQEGDSGQFTLLADREATDPEGRSSRFSSDDAGLVAKLRKDHAEVHLVVTIERAQYRGVLEHNH